jgi:N-acetylglutamate synthase-like GNAT family acetyltransferase
MVMNIQALEHSDINLIKELQPEGWPDIIPLISFYANSSFCFPIKVSINGKIVGIGTSILHHDVAWLAHIIVHPDNRNQGIGKLITQHLVDSSKAKGCDTIYLIATELGEPVYKALGFETETEYLFFKDIKAHESWKESENIFSFTEDHKTQIANLDRQVSGENRFFQLEQHLTDGYVYVENNMVEGFYLPTFGEGLIIANNPSAGLELLKLRLRKKNNAVFPIDNVIAAAFMRDNNFKELKTAKRMKLGANRIWQAANIYNRIGGNLG